MNENVDQELNETIKAVDSYLEKEARNETRKSSRATRDSKSQRTMQVLGGLVLLVLIILVARTYRSGNNLSLEDLNGVRADLAQLEERLGTLEGKITFLEKSGKDLQQSILGAERSGESFSADLTRLTQEIGQFEKRIASIEEKKRAQSTKEYYEVRPGDTLYRISQKYGILVDELRRLNGMTSKHVIHPGQKLIIPQGSKQ